MQFTLLKLEEINRNLTDSDYLVHVFLKKKCPLPFKSFPAPMPFFFMLISKLHGNLFGGLFDSKSFHFSFFVHTK
ncbi:hypothetical protein NG20_11355 [Bacillus subtilis]|nr:hypothetical protein BGM23_01520 [Bacillus sp. FJAT-14266]AOL31737.1 hypothetical protein BGM20_14330 [Alkalicoccobacillus gibsonii]KFC30142.1 hypothetical protein ZQL_17285 [Bacillus subtilis]KKJ81622.1 hypothetical protein NG20_11355 [Bacillus subtilis]KOS72951.1 hypothetical protein AEA11_00480 [Bacillus subtilis]